MTIPAGLDLKIAGFDPYMDCEGFHYDPVKGERPVRFSENHCHHIEGDKIGQKILLELWQKSFFRNIFGWVNSKGIRRFRRVFLYIPRKNGKTAICGVLVNFCLFCEKEGGAQMYGAASKLDQAGQLFKITSGIINKNPKLSDRAKVKNYRNLIELKKDKNTFFKILPADAKKEHGGGAQLAVIDELHVQPDRELYSVMKSSQVGRTQPLFIMVSTADYYRESICNEQLQYAKDVRDGIISDPRFFPVIYETSTKADWHDPEVWKAANPNLGVSVDLDIFEDLHRDASNNPKGENEFKRLHLNIQTEQLDRWINMDSWKSCNKTFTEKSVLREVCYAGLDIAATEDISSLVFYFVKSQALIPYFFIAAEMIPKHDAYKGWVDKGLIKVFGEKTTDTRKIREFFMEKYGIYRCEALAYDPYHAQEMCLHLEDEGVPCLKFNQNAATYTEPCTKFNQMIQDHVLRHNENPVLKWMASNIAVKKLDGDLLYPTKKGSFGKIDGIVASIMAFGASLTGIDSESVYAKGRVAPVY